MAQIMASAAGSELETEAPDIRFHQAVSRFEGSLTSQTIQSSAPLVQAKPLEMPVGSTGWSEGVGERVRWMASQGVQRAEIHLHPKELGPMEIRLTMRDEVAQVSIHAAHATTREAVDASIPRLREMLSEANINLGSVDVGQRDSASAQQQGRGMGEAGGQAREGFSTAEEAEEMADLRPQLRSQGYGLVDDFA
jgi:flagellar hook-length control protein FliK